MDLPFDPAIPPVGIDLKEPKPLIQKNISTPMSIAALFEIAKKWKQPKHPPVDEWIKQLQDIYTMQYCGAMKNKKILPFVTVWMDLENITHKPIRESQIPYDFPHT